MTTTDGNARSRHTSRWIGRRSAVNVAVFALALSAIVVATPSSVPVVAQSSGVVTNEAELYAAVAAANATTGATVTIDPGVYQLTTPLVVTGESTRIEGAAGPIGFDSDTRTVLAGDDATVIRGTEQAFIIAANDVTITGVAITGADGGRKSGGAIAVNRNRTGFVLSESTIVANSASEGAGVFVERNAEATIEGSTFVGNTTSGKGGGVRVAGSVDVVNSTFTDNTAQSGGAVSVAGSATISYSTFVDNDSNNSKGGGVDRNGGTLAVTGSILTNALQSGSDGSDCSGTPDLVGVNFVGNTQGCNPSAATLTRAIAGPLLLGPLADNGGPTQTIAQLDDSPAIDAGPTACLAVTSGQTTKDEPNGVAVTTDQRGLRRPSNGADDTPTPCDLGAYERARLSVDASLTVDTSRYEVAPYNLDAGTVEVGVVSVPTSQIAFELATRTPTNDDGTVNTAGLRSIGLRSIGLRSITLEDIGLRSIDLEAAGLRSIDVKASGLRSIGLRSIGLRSIGLRSIGLRSIGLRSIPLSEIPLLADGGWTEFLQGTNFAGVPLQSITLEDIASEIPDTFTLESIDLSSTGLRSIGLRSILLAGIGLRSIPVPSATGEFGNDDAATWCELLFGAERCADPAFVAEVGDAELWEAQLAGGNIDQERVLEVPLAGLNDALIEEGLASTGLRSIGLRSIGLRSIFLENTGLRSIGLRSIGLRSIDGLSTIIDCSAPGEPCSTAETNTVTLGDVVAGCLPPELIGEPGYSDPENCLLKTGATLGDLFDLLAIPFDEDGDGDTETLLDGLNLFDILFAFVAPEDVPWEAIELDGALLQNIADPLQPTFDYRTEVTVTEGPADLDVVLNLPHGFAVATPVALDPTTTATWCPVGAPTCTDAISPQQPLALGNPTYAISGVPSGTYVLKVPVRAGLTAGLASEACSLEDIDACAFPTMVTVTAVGPNGEPPAAVAGPVDVTVVEASIGGPGKAPILQDGQLQLGHITSTDDLDLYKFEIVDDPTVTGSSARVLLSNIPEGVDYDLAVYGPRPDSLRGTPTDARSALVEASFDLDPDDDVLPTDVVDDIAVDINNIAAADLTDDFSLAEPYALRDISSRRSNNDEEVTIPAIVAGETYIIAVSAYYNDLSPDPYGLRVRLDGRTAIPVCAARTTAYPGPVAAGTNPLPVQNGITNTLYVTNLSRLAAENGGSVAGVIDGIVGTDGVNGVRAGILQVDQLSAWNTWNNDRCNPDARNAVVSAIGSAIDDVVEAQGSTIEHIVLVGGDGVIPMAAVPDLTTYSNESTFARELLTSDGKSNEAVAALASGYLLSDDPYATAAGISILGGDHELYLPERSIGRLVETAGEIAGQLDNFATFDGTLDPGTFNASAAVTAYDFLDDGGDAIAEELRAAGFDVDQLTDADPLWDREDYLDLLAGTDRAGIDRKIVSPNAHYDFESLLPAAPDDVGYFTDAQLVTTGDVAALGNGFDSLVFTVGCHAGFSVSDVQLQHPALDWAQLNAQNTNQFVAHTTYGYGDTTIVAYSERLAQLFAENIAAMVGPSATSDASLGQAVRDAKERYLAGTLVLTPYDEKILQSWTYYGLPMYTLGAIVDPGAGTTTEDPLVTFDVLAGATTLQDATPLVEGPASFVTENGTTTVDIDLGGDVLDLVEVDENNDTTPDSFYYQVDGNSIVAQYRPVQPLVDVEIPVTGNYQGFLITGLTTQDLPDTYVPFYSNPLIDNSANETRIVVGDGAFPATLQRVSDVTGGQRLLVAAGEYESGQRLFRQISGELIARGAADDDVASRFLDVIGRRVTDVGGGGQGVQFDVVTDGDAVRAVVLFREDGALEWRSIELAGPPAGSDGTRRWFGSAPLFSSSDGEVEFFVQNVDGAGNVGISRNKIENFSTTDADDADAIVGIEYTGDPAKEFAGRYYASGAEFTIEGGTAASRFSIDSGALLPYNPTTGITIVHEEDAAGAYDPATGELQLDRGPHVLFAEEGSDRVYRFFILDPDAPTVEVIASTTDWTKGPVDVTITATDAGAGVASIDYSCGAATCEDITPVGSDPAIKVLRVSVEGLTTISATATDNVGNTSTPPSTADVRIDATPPVVTVTPATTEWSATPVDVKITATDTGSGVASIDCNGCELAELTIDPITGVATKEIVVPTEGVTTVSATATDNVGNPSSPPSTGDVRIDLTAPEVTSFTVTPDADADGVYTLGETVTATFACADAHSGIASCELFDGTTRVAVASPYTIDTSSPGTRTLTVTATDSVDRTFTSPEITVTVAYGACLLYDPTQEKNIGSNYTIKLRLCDSQGSNLSARNITLTALTVDLTTDPGPNDSGKANDGYEFRYSQGDQSYIYNLDTTGLSAEPHRLYFTTQQVPEPLPTDPDILNTYIDAAPAPFVLR